MFNISSIGSLSSVSNKNLDIYYIIQQDSLCDTLLQLRPCHLHLFLLTALKGQDLSQFYDFLFNPN